HSTGDAFPGGSSPFLSSYVSSGLPGSSAPHGTPAPMTSDPSFRAPTPSNLQMAQLWASHPHEGFPHLPSSLYPSPYIPLGLMEHPSSGSPLLTQLSQHALFDSQKEGYYLPGHTGQSALHSQPSISRTSASHVPGVGVAPPREKEAPPHPRGPKDNAKEASREKLYKSDPPQPLPRKDRERDRDREREREKDRPKEEARPRSVVDLTQEMKVEGERRLAGPDRPLKSGERTSPFHHDHSPSGGAMEPKSKNPLQTSSLANCNSGGGGGGGSGISLRYEGGERERCAKDLLHDENMRPGAHVHMDKSKKCDSVVTSVGTLHVSCSCPSPHGGTAQLPPRLVNCSAYNPSHHMPPSSLYPLYSPAKEPGREHKVIAPTFVPSVEVYDERNGPIQIASQARDNKNEKNREKDCGRSGVLQVGGERTLSDPTWPPHVHESHSDAKRVELFREEGSVIRSNSLAIKRPPPSETYPGKPGHSPDSRDYVLTSTTSKEMLKIGLETDSRGQEQDRIQRASVRDSGRMYNGVDPPRVHMEQHPLKSSAPSEPKWKPFQMGNYATSHMAALAAQHGHGNRVEEDGKGMYLDSSGLHRPGAGGPSRGSGEGLHSGTHSGEVSAMQSLIKYSGSFTKDSSSRHGSGLRSPFGGLGNMKPEAGQPGNSKSQHSLPQQPGKQLKRDPERPESAKSFGRESIGPQGEVEVRHPPVGIAVAVARQRDSGTKPASSLADRDRPLPLGSIKGPGRPEDDRRDDRGHHREDRLLTGRLEREQEKLLRENKELAEYTQMHPPMGPSSGLNPNLMVTGGPVLAASGRWPTDPASQLTPHPWIPRTGNSSLWLPGSPYGLGHSSLHQGLPPGYPPTLPGSIPSPYHFARDPQSGQLLVIPTEHLPHFGADLMERGPPMWPSMFPPTGSSLQHAHQLQLLSHQQLLRQQELYMIQQQAAQVMELQRNAQLAERLKVSEQRAELEEKAAKRSSDGAKPGFSAASAPALHSRKPPSRSPTPSTSYAKALMPVPVTPLPSPGATLKSEAPQKVQSPLPRPSYSRSSSPAAHPLSPTSASPPPPPPLPPKEESVEEMEKKKLDIQSQPPPSFRALYPEIPPGYPYQSITAPFGSHYPYLLQPAAAADADGLAPDVPLPAETSEHLAASADVKAVRLLSPATAEPSRVSGTRRTLEDGPALKEEPGLEDSKEVLGPAGLGPLHSGMALPPMASQDHHAISEQEGHSRGAVLQEEAQEEEEGEAEERRKVKLEELSIQSCQTPHQVTELVSEMASVEEVQKGTSCVTERDIDFPVQHREAQAQVFGLQQPARTPSPHCEAVLESPGTELVEERSDSAEHLCEAQPLYTPFPPVALPPMDQLDIRPDDPMAGMMALVTASELPQACSLPTVPGTPGWVIGSSTSLLPLEASALEGIALLSEIAELEQERRRNEMQSVVHCGLESLLLAGRQVLLEAIDCASAVTIRLPRELNPNKKYSWMQKKDESLFSMKSSMDRMNTLELDYRMRLAELQRRYKDKQRELVKLQRHRESEEKLEEKSRSLARRGPGRPRKRKHGACPFSMPVGKLDTKCGKFSRSALLSEDSETSEGARKRFRGPSLDDDEEMDGGVVKVKRKSKGWSEHEASSSYSQQMQMKSTKRKKVSEQEQLASKLDKALSLTKLGKFHKSPFQFADETSGKAKGLMLHEVGLKGKEGEGKSRSKGLGLFQKPSKGGKNKMAAKTKNMEPCLKVKSQLKPTYSPARSELSSYSYNTDSEENDGSMKDGWPPRTTLGRPGPRGGRGSGLRRAASKKSRPSSKRSAASGTLASKQALLKTKHKHFALLLQEAEARSSFSDSSEDSFDQGY
ncbi:hypothetical protein JZ751_026149, partial [Albula glossodonta]